MKLLSQKEAQSYKKRENDALIDSNIRLRKYWQDITHKLSTAKNDYSTDKLEKQAEFERFCKDIQDKREKLLQELASLQKQIEDKREIYYGLIVKQDELQEVKYKIQEEYKKLDLREAFVLDLEEKWRNKQ